MEKKASEKDIQKSLSNNNGGFFSEIVRNKYIYLLALPGILYFIIFTYIPMCGTIVAFKAYDISKGIFGSPWNGLDNFNFFFTSGSAWRVTKNTILLNAAFITTITIAQITFAILLNEIQNKFFKKVSQSLMFLPYFMSWVVVSVIALGFMEFDTGSLNQILRSIGLEPVNWYGMPQIWPMILILFNIWKWTGYGVVIFLAAITGFEEELYEAATIDGATRFQQIRYITLPLLVPTIMILTLLAIGRIFFGDFGMIYGMVGDNSTLFPTTDVIDTYVYRALRQQSDFGMAAATGLYQTVMGFVLVLASNLMARKYREDGALF